MAEEKMEAPVKPLCISKEYRVPQRGSTSETLIHTDKLHVISRKHLWNIFSHLQITWRYILEEQCSFLNITR